MKFMKLLPAFCWMLFPLLCLAQTHTYDAAGRLVWSTQPGGASSSFTYDANGNLLATVNIGAAQDTNGNGIPDSFEIQYTGSVTGMNALGDPSGDGVVNLLKYALARDPSKPDGGNLTPESLTVSGTGKYLTLQYLRPKQGPLLLNYIVEVSYNLSGGSWSSSSSDVQQVSVVDQGGGVELVTTQAVLPTSSKNRIFIRLRVVTLH